MLNKNLLYSSLTVFIVAILQLVFIRYASYGISKIDYGNFVLLQILVAGLSSLFLQSPGAAFERFYNESERKIDFVNEFRTLIVLINIPCLIIIIMYGMFFTDFNFLTSIGIFFWFFFMSNYEVNQRLYLYNLERKKYLFLQTLESLSKFILPIFAYLYFQTMISIIYGIAVGYFFSLIIVLSQMNNYKFEIKINLQNFKKYFFYSSPIVLVGIFTWGISFSDRYFINYYLETKDVALYSILSMIAGFGAIIGSIYNIYGEPKVLKEFVVNKNNSFKMTNSYMLALSMFFSSLLVIMLILPKEFWTILVEPEIIYDSYYFLSMIFLIIGIFINVLHVALRVYLKLFKSLHILSFMLLIALIINLIGNLFIDQYGIIAAALSTLLAYISILIMEICYIRWYLRK